MADPHEDPHGLGIPSLEPRQDPDFATCPFCTMQMPFDARTCPHCNSPNPAVRDFREQLVPPARFPVLADFLRRYWQPLSLGSAIALAFLVTAVVHYGWIGHGVTVVPNPSFAVDFDHRVEDGKVVIEGTVRNLGEDIPDLSLKSVRLTAAFALETGGRRVESVFPRVENRGEGAMLKGETGTFRFSVPESQVRDATLSVAVIDLTCGRPSENCVVPSPPPDREITLPK